MSLRWLKVCAAMPLVVAVSGASGERVQPAGGKHSAIVVAKSDKSRGHNASSAVVPTPSENVRMTIATFLEGQPLFRKYDDDGAPKLVNAKIAGPILGLRKSAPEQPVYCIQVDLILTNRNLTTLQATRDELDAVLTFIATENGGRRIQGQVVSVSGRQGLPTCNKTPYTPFPELEQVRAQRRRALGKTDSQTPSVDDPSKQPGWAQRHCEEDQSGIPDVAAPIRAALAGSTYPLESCDDSTDANCTTPLSMLSCLASVSIAKELPKVEESISGWSFRAIQVAELELKRNNLDVIDYRIVVWPKGSSVVVLFGDPNAPPGQMGSSGKKPGFEVELRPSDLQVIRSHFSR